MDLLILVLLLANTGLGVWLAAVILQIRESVEQIRDAPAAQVRIPEVGPTVCCEPPRMKNYAAWTYRQGAWQLTEDRTEKGFIPGDPPRRPGAFEGETVRKPAVRSGA